MATKQTARASKVKTLFDHLL